MSTENKYTPYPTKIQKQEAIELLHTFHLELLKAEKKYYRAVRWAYDIQHLTFQEISTAMGKKSKVWAFNVYNKIIKKGGDEL